MIIINPSRKQVHLEKYKDGFESRHTDFFIGRKFYSGQLCEYRSPYREKIGNEKHIEIGLKKS